MAAKKELTCRMVLIDHAGGVKRERNWEDIPEEERGWIAGVLTDNAMRAAGYIKLKEA